MFFKKKTYISSGSLSSLALRKFRRNKPGYFSVIFIGIVIIIAILGYLITPDNTPYANDQYLELGLKKPGFSVNILRVRKNQRANDAGLLETMIWGRPGDYVSIPIGEFRFSGRSIIVDEYSNQPGNPYSTLKFNLADVVYPLGTDTSNIKSVNGYLVFRDIYGQEIRKTPDELSIDLLTNNIEKRTFWLGTDRFGRDMLSQLIIGTRVSISVGFISVFISLVIGIFIGALGGFFRGWIDNIVVWFINVIWSIPTLLLVIAITFALGKGFWQVFVAVGLTMWVEVARVVRGQILSIREKEFVEAGKALGFTNFRIIFRHILPNILGIVIVISAANFASAILLEAGLSFLGIGVQPPMPSWGAMIKENYGYIVLDSAYLAIIPGFAIMLLVLAFMLAGNALRDALDVRTSAV